MTFDEQYLAYLDKIMTHGQWVENERTGVKCLTLINHDFTYKADESQLLTVKQSFPVGAVAETIGYLRGYDNAEQFDKIGTKTWYANANETKAWLQNPYRKGDNDMGMVYGVVGRDFGGIDLVKKVYQDLKQGVDDRGEIITFWKPDTFHRGCLRPCLHSYQFSILNGKLYLNATQRSGDAGLGIPHNAIQTSFLLKLMAKITGLEVGEAYHKVVNNHIYENQIVGVKEILSRKPLDVVTGLEISEGVSSLDDVLNDEFHSRDYINVVYPEHLGKIKFDMVV